MRDKIFLVSHVYFTDSGPVYGPVNVIKDYLESKKRKYRLIKYPLTSRLPLIIKSFLETLNTVLKGILYKPDVFIGIDPLNALAGIILKKLGFTRKTVFYCVDYTPTRFRNKFLNLCYLNIDEFCAKYSDEVWNVSSRIVELRKKQGVKSERIKYLPNSPNFNSCPRSPANRVDRNKIAMVTGLAHGQIFPILLKSFQKVSRKYPSLKLILFGTGEYEDKLRSRIKAMGFAQNVIFCGQLENRDLLREISKCGLGLALYSYSPEFSWVFYGDSKKAREYLACGLPVIINDVVATSDDVKKYKAGILVELNVESISSAIELMMSDAKFWLECKQNAILLARALDFERLLSLLLQ